MLKAAYRMHGVHHIKYYSLIQFKRILNILKFIPCSKKKFRACPEASATSIKELWAGGKRLCRRNCCSSLVDIDDVVMFGHRCRWRPQQLIRSMTRLCASEDDWSVRFGRGTSCHMSGRHVMALSMMCGQLWTCAAHAFFQPQQYASPQRYYCLCEWGCAMLDGSVWGFPMWRCWSRGTSERSSACPWTASFVLHGSAFPGRVLCRRAV